ncbi:hypothetical protein ACA910_012670 [Epithemia clementina (nom. ined.)]
MSQYPENNATQDAVDLHDVTDTLGPDGGGAHAIGSTAYSRESYKKKRLTKMMIYGTIVTVVLVVIIGVSIAAAGGGKKSGNTAPVVGVALPPAQVPETQHDSNRKKLSDLLVPLYTARGMDMATVSDATTFQGRALDYVAGSELFEQLTDVQIVERYAAVVFYLSTYRQPHLLNDNLEDWPKKQNWLTDTAICLWEGIECDAEERVVGIVLQENKMSGVLPLELSLLENLAKLDFTSNLIYMDQDYHGLWSILPNLRQLLMDDNFFISETGIPAEFADLGSIEKISLSFNLLQGSFQEDVFGYMQNLVHFEAESNYISGPLPADFVTLPNLTYIYLRRNSLEFQLSEVLVPGNWPALFALWLDGNTIKGVIPETIAIFDGLASLSITDAHLTGSIPDEMAALTDLQRLWLYNNKLSGSIPEAVAAAWSSMEVFEIYGNDLNGTMPVAICTAVQNSGYELATITADCQEIECSCCTECF